MILSLYLEDKLEIYNAEHPCNARFSLNQNVLHPNSHSSRRVQFSFYEAFRLSKTLPITAKSWYCVNVFKNSYELFL